MANLASIILEGTNQTPSVDLGNFDFSDTVVAESSYSDAAVATLFSDIMEAEQGYMVADVVGAATVIRESANGNEIDPVAVSEGVIKNGIAKIKAAFQKFLAKIKEYYKRVINWFKAMFSNGEDFVKNYGDMLRKKSQKVKGFHYTGYKYDIKAGDSKVTDATDAINKRMVDIMKGYDFVKDAKTTAEFNDHLRSAKVILADFDADKKPSTTEDVEDFLKGIKYDDIADLKSSITDVYRDDAANKTDIKDFEANSLDSMLNFVKSSKTAINNFEKQLKNYEDKTNKVISQLGKFESEKDEDGGSNLVANCSYVSSLMTAYLNLYKAPCEVQIAIYKAASSEFLGALKKFYNYKGNAVKESTEVFDADAFATLENDLVLFEGDDADCGGKGGDDDDDDKAEGTTESTIASILEQASSFTF